VPELPEVETIARGLCPVLEGNRILRADVWRANVVVGPVHRFTRAVEGRRVERVSRRAKLLRFDLEGGWVWWTSLRMTGMYLIQSASDAVPRSEPRDAEQNRSRGRKIVGSGKSRVAGRIEPGRRGSAPSTRARRAPPPAGPPMLPPFARGRFDLESGDVLYYVDIRTLGKMGVVDRATWESRARELGPEPLGRSFTADELHRRLRRTRRRIKEVLLDQRVIAGVGNIYASEALHRAGIHPRARSDRLTGPAVRELHAAIRAVLREAIASRGTTFLTYADAEGESGAFAERLRVYDRAAEACPNCGGPVRRIVQAQRSTYYCPRCQRRR
jgi:formamidopyrimidine-DNA glycosylase